MPGKERISGFGNAFLKKDKSDEKPTFKYSSKLICSSLCSLVFVLQTQVHRILLAIEDMTNVAFID